MYVFCRSVSTYNNFSYCFLYCLGALRNHSSKLRPVRVQQLSFLRKKNIIKGFKQITHVNFTKFNKTMSFSKDKYNINTLKNNIYFIFVSGAFRGHSHLRPMRLQQFRFHGSHAGRLRSNGATPEEGFVSDCLQCYDRGKCRLFHDSLYRR